MKFIRVLCFAMVVLCLRITMLPIISVQAQAIDNGDKPFLVTPQQNGGLIIEAEAKTASSGIRWRTIGFNISTEPLKDTESTKGIKGYESVSSVDTKPLPFSNAVEKVDDVNGNITNTTLTYNVDQVAAALGTTSGAMSGTYYFHAVFEVYQIVNGKEVVLQSNINDWKDIVNNQGWGSPGDFDNYYNMKIELDPVSPVTYPNDLYLVAPGESLGHSSLGNASAGSSISWSGPETITKTKGGKAITYKFVDFEASAKKMRWSWG